MLKITGNKNIQILSAIFLLLAMSSCTTTPPSDPRDPIEPLNRQIFKFNTVVDHAVYRPVAKAYDKVIPAPVDRSITNFFSNLGEIPTVINDLLQINLPLAVSDTSRFAVNSTVGVLGLFDPASHMNLPKHRQDFGLTLAHWGYTDSMYFVIPFLGPSTIRDTISWGVGYYTTIYPYIPDPKIRYSLMGLDFINQRAALLPSDPLVDDAFDPYALVRSAYLQRRENQIETLKNEGQIIKESTTFLGANAQPNKE